MTPLCRQIVNVESLNIFFREMTIKIYERSLNIEQTDPKKKLHSLQWEEAKTLQLNFRFRSCEDEFRILRENILLFNIHEFTKNIYF